MVLRFFREIAQMLKCWAFLSVWLLRTIQKGKLGKMQKVSLSVFSNHFMCIFNYSNTNFKNNYIKNLLVSTKKKVLKNFHIFILQRLIMNCSLLFKKAFRISKVNLLLKFFSKFSLPMVS